MAGTDPAESGRREQMQIGVVAERTELSIRTLRHYDELGLVRPSARTAGGFRLYTETDIDRLRTIRRMKPLGFSLEEMTQLLASLDVLGDPAASGPRRQAASTYVAECHTRAEQSCETLRRQLAYAEEFQHLLAARV